jgi:predicted transcriptional regulator
MTIAEIKVDILKQIAATNDGTFLKEVLNYIRSLRKDQDWWDELDEDEIASIEEGNRQLEDGEGIPHEKVREKVKQMLGK